ncbi:MAG: hypothetical protein ACR2PB_12540 [Desulfocapsaceae bacterium]
MDGYDVSVEQLSQLNVYDEQGEKKGLSELWAAQPAAMVFVRHFG